MADFNKEKALDELLAFFTQTKNPSFSDTMKSMQIAQNYLEVIHLESFQKGLEAGLKKIDIENDQN